MQHACPISLNVAAAARWPFGRLGKSTNQMKGCDSSAPSLEQRLLRPTIFNELYSKLTLAPLTVESHKWPWQLSLNPFEFQMRQRGGHHGASIFFSSTTQHGATRGFCLPAAISRTVHLRSGKRLQFQIQKYSKVR
jgi:hypothetical protein